MWFLFAVFVIVFAASVLMDHEYDDLDGYQQFMYVLINIALYMVLLLSILILVAMVVFGISFGVISAKIVSNSSCSSADVYDRHIYESA